MTEGPRVNFVMREASRIQSLYLYFIKLSRFGYEITVFKFTTGRYSEQLPE